MPRSNDSSPLPTTVAALYIILFVVVIGVFIAIVILGNSAGSDDELGKCQIENSIALAEINKFKAEADELYVNAMELQSRLAAANEIRDCTYRFCKKQYKSVMCR